MPKGKGDTEITIPTYIDHEIVEKENEIVIVLWSQTGRITIRCKRNHDKTKPNS